MGRKESGTGPGESPIQASIESISSSKELNRMFDSSNSCGVMLFCVLHY